VGKRKRLDGVGIPYYNELEEEDEMERARR
jgi:hypothetical protein